MTIFDLHLRQFSSILPLVLLRLHDLFLMFCDVLYPPQKLHFSPTKWNFAVDCYRRTMEILFNFPAVGFNRTTRIKISDDDLWPVFKLMN